MAEKRDYYYEVKRAENRQAKQTMFLQLYVAGSSQQSRRAIANVRKICQDSLQGVYELQVIDIFQQPLLAKAEQIVAVPTLIKKLPGPKRLFIGDLSDSLTILARLNS